MINWIILILILIFIIFFSRLLFIRYVYLDIDIENLDKYLYVLLYKGFAENSIFHSGIMNISSLDRIRDIGIIKYKNRNKIGLYLLFWIDEDIKDREFFIKEELEKRNLIFYIKNINGKKSHRYILVDLHNDFEKCKSLLIFLWKKVYNFEENKIYFNFERVCRVPGKIIDFKDKSKLEKLGIDIDIPITNWDWLMGKLRIKKFTV